MRKNKKNIMVKKELTSSHKWVSFTINEKFRKRDYLKNIISAIRRIFKGDCVHIFFIGEVLDSENYKNELDGYVFAKCKNIDAHVTELKNVTHIDNILHSYDNVYYFTNGEIRDLISDWRIKRRNSRKQAEVVYGDIVKIRAGRYKDLIGIVIGRSIKYYDVCFQFNFGIVKEKFLYDNLFKKSNLFNSVKYPYAN